MNTSKYIVAIVGFTDADKALSAVDEMMKDEGIWLFTVIGTEKNSVAKEVAEKLGCSYQYCKSLKELEYQCNYIIADVSAGQEIKNFVMHMKAAGKHGRVTK